MQLLTLARDIQRRKGREQKDTFAAEGVRCIEELLKSPISIVGLLVDGERDHTSRSRELIAAMASRGVETLELSAADFLTAANTESSQGMVALAKIPKWSLSTLDLHAKCRCLILDGVQDPGNAGTIMRTAAALGVDAVIAAPGTVDVWNPKVVRSAMGTNFRMAVVARGWNEIDDFVRTANLVVWGADVGGAALGSDPVPERLALVVGNEGAGLSTDAQSRVQHAIALAIDPLVESLNVAVATGILLYELRA